MNRRPAQIAALVWAAVMIAILSSTLTLALTGRNGGERHWLSQEEYDRLDRYSRLDSVRETLMTKYYQPLDEQALITGAIRGMTAAVGDVYTFYYTPEELDREREDDAGRYQGIGVLVERNQNGNIAVVRVYPGSPAESAGLKVGDIVYSVDGEAVDALTADHYRQGVALMRGDGKTDMALGIRRDDQLIDVTVSRSDISISYTEYSIIDGRIGYAAIAQFSGDAADRFEAALAYFRDNGVEGMIVDLRNNPGGLLDYVTRIADLILPEGVIVYTEDRQGERVYHRSDAEYYDVPLVVLVNDMSASASEILAASVQALGRGTVVGVQTYGKGVVQTLIQFGDDGSGLQYTTASYFDADGRSINGVGVTPDLEVALDAGFVPFEPDPVSDNQLAAAIRVLEQQMGR